MGKGAQGVDTLGGIVLKCPPSPQLSSPHSLKEQLELIHQIIQQTTEESVIFTSGANFNLNRTGQQNCAVAVINSKPASSSSSLRKTVPGTPSTATATSPTITPTTNSTTTGGVVIKDEEKIECASTVTARDDLNFNVNLGVVGAVKGEDKVNQPVECAICCRRFKNTPALNGHMRLHGGYFKKVLSYYI